MTKKKEQMTVKQSIIYKIFIRREMLSERHHITNESKNIHLVSLQ